VALCVSGVSVKLSKLQIILVLLMFSSNSFAKDEHLKACISLYKISASAINYMKQGKTKEELLAPLPARSVLEKNTNLKDGRVLIGLSMHDIIDDIFAYEVLPISVYAPYTSEQCVRRAKKLPLLPFSDAYPLLKSCSLLNEQEHVTCVFNVVKGKNT
jgi:hypothetical protein